MAKDRTVQNSMIGVLVLIVIWLIVFPDTFLTITDIGVDGQCKIVVDGSVCDNYTQCTYLSDRDVSCVKGYEIITIPVSIPMLSTSVTEISGGSNE
ncbi:hypothetical protein GQ473_01110 [archaeon]|nr:hypothetical protein [archaeon]